MFFSKVFVKQEIATLDTLSCLCDNGGVEAIVSVSAFEEVILFLKI